MKLRNVLFIALLFAMLPAFAIEPEGSSASTRFESRIADLASDISSKSRNVGTIKIGILGFSGNDDQTTAFGKMVSEELTAKLFVTGKYRIIERELLVKILKEQKFELTGPVDPSAIKQLGKLLAIDAVLTGSITDTAVGLRINARLISTTSGEVLSVGSTTLAKDAFITSFMRMAFQEVGADVRDDGRGGKLETLVKQNGFIFECKRFYTLSDSPDDLYVDVIITNLGQDRELSLGDHMRSGYNRGATQVTTKAGKQIPIFDIFVGRQTSNQRVLFGNYRHSGIRKLFPSRQPVTVTFDFKGRNVFGDAPIALDLLTSSYGKDRDELLLHLRIPQHK